MLIGVDILASEDLLIDFPLKKIAIGVCKGFSTTINTMAKGERTERLVKNLEDITVLAYSIAGVPVAVQEKGLPANQDFVFNSHSLHQFGKASGYAHIVDANFSWLLAGT